MLTSILVTSLSFATSILAQSFSACGPIQFTSQFGPLFVEDNGNLTVPYDNNTVLPGAQSGSSFYIESDSSMFVLSSNGTQLYCHPFIWMQCNQTSPQPTGHEFTIGSDGLLYVSENSDFYVASEFSGMVAMDRPVPSHLYPAFEGTHAFTSIEGGNWGWSDTQLKANTCYAGHANSQTAPTPTASHGTSVNIAAATARPIAMGLGAAMLGFAAFV